MAYSALLRGSQNRQILQSLKLARLTQCICTPAPGKGGDHDAARVSCSFQDSDAHYLLTPLSIYCQGPTVRCGLLQSLVLSVTLLSKETVFPLNEKQGLSSEFGESIVSLGLRKQGFPETR